MSALVALLVLADDFPNHMNDGWGWAMLVTMLLFWALIALAVVWGVRSYANQRRDESGGPTPMELLDRRLADGSISMEDYEQRRRVLLGQSEQGRA